jgi:transposase
MNKNKLSEEKINKIIKLTVDGASRPEISKEVKTSKVTVWKYQKLYCQGIR